MHIIFLTKKLTYYCEHIAYDYGFLKHGCLLKEINKTNIRFSKKKPLKKLVTIDQLVCVVSPINSFP